MSYVELAIREAQTAGFWPYANLPKPWEYSMILLEPIFWQYLGKARGWGTEMTLIDEPGHPKEWMYYTHCARCHEQIIDQEDGCPSGCDCDDAYIEAWVMEWHRFIDHLAEGKDAESFFKDLLPASTHLPSGDA